MSEKVESAGATPARPKSPQRRRTSLLVFYRQIVAELRKVVWPTRQQLVTYFVVVVVFVVVMIAIVSGLDLGFGKAVFAVLGK